MNEFGAADASFARLTLHSDNGDETVILHVLNGCGFNEICLCSGISICYCMYY